MIPGPTSLKALTTAAVDQSEKVRLMACDGLKERGDKESRDMLITLAKNPKESPSVRRAAIAGLSTFNDEDVKRTLAQVLDDKSPAIQYQTALSLKTLTGRDYGGDIDSWREYMAGKDVPEPEKSLVASFWESMGLNR
jgi:HEAT repeat protein